MSSVTSLTSLASFCSLVLISQRQYFLWFLWLFPWRFTFFLPLCCRLRASSGDHVWRVIRGGPSAVKSEALES